MPRRAPPSAPAPAASGKRAREHVADDDGAAADDDDHPQGPRTTTSIADDAAALVAVDASEAEGWEAQRSSRGVGSRLVFGVVSAGVPTVHAASPLPSPSLAFARLPSPSLAFPHLRSPSIRCARAC